MISKQVLDRERSAREVSATRVHGETIQRAVDVALRPFLREGEALPDAQLLVELLLRRMEARLGALVETDRLHNDELADDPPLRAARESGVETLRASLMELFEVVVGIYGGGARTALWSGRLDNDPARLVHSADVVIRGLPGAALGESRLTGVELDRAAWVTRLSSEQAALSTALEALAREGREAEQTLQAKHVALAASDEAFTEAASMVAALLRFADEPELARRVRPSVRKPGRRVVEVENDGGSLLEEDT